MKHQFYIALVMLCVVAALPAFLFGFQLAVWTGSLLVIPVPVILCCIGMGWFGYKAENSL